MATRRANAPVLIGLAQAAIDNESVTPYYNRGAVKGFVNVLDGWTVPVGIALLNIKHHDPTMFAILNQHYDGLDFIVESVDVLRRRRDGFSLLEATLDASSKRKIDVTPRGLDQAITITVEAPQQIDTPYDKIKDLFQTESFRRRELILPNSFAFFANRFAILCQHDLPEDTKLEVLMQLFLYWGVMNSRNRRDNRRIGEYYHYSTSQWYADITVHQDHEVYGKRSFRNMKEWWMEHVQGQQNHLKQSMSMRCLGERTVSPFGTTATSKKHDDFEEDFTSMVANITTLFENVNETLKNVEKSSSRFTHHPYRQDARSSASTRRRSASPAREFQAVSRHSQGRGHHYVDEDAQTDDPTER